jgi:PIN domain
MAIELPGTSFTVVYDASVLYPAPLRDLLMWVAIKGLVGAKWTDEIQEEWLRNLLEQRPDLDEQRLRRTQRRMNRALPDARVTGHEDLIAALELPDPDDRHVLAAAIRAGAQTIVTANIRDFPVSALDRYGIEAERPDPFLVGLLDVDQHLFLQAIRAQLKTLTNPPQTSDQLLDTLQRNGLVQTVAALRPIL